MTKEHKGNKYKGIFWCELADKDKSYYIRVRLNGKVTRVHVGKKSEGISGLMTLIEADYIKVGRYNKHKYDRTSWYTLTEKGESIFPYRLDLVPKRAEGLDKKGAPIQDINTNKKLDINNEDTRLRLEALANRCGIAL